MLAASGIKLDQVRDGWNFTDQTQPVESALLNIGIAPRELSYPSDLRFGRLDKLIDLFRRSARLLPLNLDQRSLNLDLSPSGVAPNRPMLR